jgi:hypothetical protein
MSDHHTAIPAHALVRAQFVVMYCRARSTRAAGRLGESWSCSGEQYGQDKRRFHGYSFRL